MYIKAYSDGACRGNPGPASYGLIIYDQNGNKLHEDAVFLGEGLTNNIAEYEGIRNVLLWSYKNNYRNLIMHADSELAIKQLTGKYKVKNPGIKKIFSEIQNILAEFDRVEFRHVVRSLNQEADHLANKALDQAGY